MSLVGLEMNETRVRAVMGPIGDYPLSLPLEPPAQHLPLALDLEKNTPEVGSPGLRWVRQKPHLVCQGFLSSIDNTEKTWTAGRTRLDARKALGQVWQRLEPMCRRARVVAATLPSYLTKKQIEIVKQLGDQARVPILGTVSAPLAAALVGYAEQTWMGSVLIVDVDDHALTLAYVKAVDGLAHVLDERSFPHLGLRVWKDRLLNALADCCVLQSRRDPRDAPLAEQAMFDQIDGLLDAALQGRLLNLGIQATTWYQNLLIQPNQPANFCAQLTRRLLHELEQMLDGLHPDEMPGSVLMTHSAGRLPGVAATLRSAVETWKQPVRYSDRPTTRLHEEDFGEDLMAETGIDHGGVAILSDDALARSAHGVAAWLLHGDLPHGHLEGMAPLPLPQPVEAGPPRLNFQGQEFVLREAAFSLGSHGACHLVIDVHRHPGVAARHCDITHDHRAFILWNRCSDGTLVNDNPVTSSVMLHAGDWIRLGIKGPSLRFLGHPNSILSA